MLRRLDVPLSKDDLAAAWLVLTELVTNAVRHGCSDRAGTIEVRVSRSPGRVRFEVSQSRPLYDEPAVQLRRPGIERGWGVLIIHELCRDWGLLPDSRTVWAEMSVDSSSSNAPEPEGRMPS